MLWLLTAVTAAALLLIAGFVKEISKVPTVAQARGADRDRACTRGTATAFAVGRPPAARESPTLLQGCPTSCCSSPWHRGCPGILDTPMFSWTAGEHAVAGRVSIGGTMIDWHGNACSGQLRAALRILRSR